jgi:hypothetical protein
VVDYTDFGITWFIFCFCYPLPLYIFHFTSLFASRLITQILGLHSFFSLYYLLTSSIIHFPSYIFFRFAVDYTDCGITPINIFFIRLHIFISYLLCAFVVIHFQPISPKNQNTKSYSMLLKVLFRNHKTHVSFPSARLFRVFGFLFQLPKSRS